MSSRPRPTLADYVVIAMSPALIMVLVGSLVFFLIEVFYQGAYDSRLTFIMAMFVMAAVLIGRISIEKGRDYAVLFAIPLAIVTAIATMRFVEFSGPLRSASTFINIGLIALTWWCADRLTWDSTVIDESKDASGEGLLQTAGLDIDATSSSEGSPKVAESAAAQPHQTLWQKFMAYRRRPHSPGVWVIYFSIAALPIFGFGNWFVPSEDLLARRYVFKLLVAYVGSALGLLLTTSFLNLRRYLRQRRLEMPLEMAGTWIATGAAMIVALLLVCTLLPRRNPEYSISQLPIFAGSPTDLWTTEYAVGNEGQEDPEKADRSGTQQPSATSSGNSQASSGSGDAANDGNRPSDNSANSTSDSSQSPGKKPAGEESSNGPSSPGGNPPNRSSKPAGDSDPQADGPSTADDNSSSSNPAASKQSPGGQKQQSATEGHGEPDPKGSSPADPRPPGEKSSDRPDGPSQPDRSSQSPDKKRAQQTQPNKSSPSERKQASQSEQPKSEQPKSEQPKSEQRKSEQRKSEQPKSEQPKSEQPKSEQPKSEQRQPKQSFDFSKIPSAIGGTLGQLLRFLYWAGAFAVIGFLLWKYWAQVREAVLNFWRSLQAFWGSLFGRKPTAEVEVALAGQAAPTFVPFSSFQDPFVTGMAQRQTPAEVIRYTFSALEAWSRERGVQRVPEQTPHEFAQSIGAHSTPIARDAGLLADLYNRCAYSRGTDQRLNIEPLRRLWQQLK